ncbi:MAG TPA: alkaline phosphatase D family protein [Rudaea sp.]|nr:alkaline phosphatase D family protein [Rudaea sp.]
MKKVSRREFLAVAASIGAVAAFARGGVAGARAAKSRVNWTERRDLYPEGVASGDPHADSVLLWTRRPGADAHESVHLTCEVATDAAFEHVVATADAKVSAASDWTCRVLVGGLQPAREYWYRFTDADGAGSRVGRTLTAPSDDDARPVHFAFVSCQNVNDGAQNAYRRMIFEDEKAAPDRRLGFVLHLGDFFYELVWYPEDRPQGMYDRRIRDILRYANGEKHEDFHIPTTVDDYRTVYRAYLRDPDLQDARARFPFVPIWDNHEFSWLGWQSFQEFDGETRARQKRKVAAMQAWFEFQPARISKPSPGLERFDAPHVDDVPIEKFDEHGLGIERNNLAALNSLTGYRALRWGRHVDLIITDQRSYRSEDPMGRAEAEAFSSKDFPQFTAEEAQRILDAGRSWNGGKPPATIRFGDADVPNFRKDAPAQTILGAKQKAWFLDRLKSSRATWKIWGNTTGTLDMRADPQNLPADITPRWPGAGYAGFGGGDHGSAYVERAEIYDFVAAQRITGFATVAGDRHSFWAGFAAKDLPPRKFAPVGVAFITGSISAPGMVESLEHKFPKDHPLRALFLTDRAGKPPEPAINLLLRHGVRTCFEYAHSADIAKAKALSNPANAPHVAFVDMGGHGYSVVRASADRFDVEFVCIPRPIERSTTPDGGPLRYRVVHHTKLWAPGEVPKLEREVIEGNVDLMT